MASRGRGGGGKKWRKRREHFAPSQKWKITLRGLPQDEEQERRQKSRRPVHTRWLRQPIRNPLKSSAAFSACPSSLPTFLRAIWPKTSRAASENSQRRCARPATLARSTAAPVDILITNRAVRGRTREGTFVRSKSAMERRPATALGMVGDNAALHHVARHWLWEVGSVLEKEWPP